MISTNLGVRQKSTSLNDSLLTEFGVKVHLELEFHVAVSKSFLEVYSRDFKVSSERFEFLGACMNHFDRNLFYIFPYRFNNLCQFFSSGYLKFTENLKDAFSKLGFNTR